jgi:squalene-hopene/tetraprenyl-beta-curcumene cyclase
VWIDQKKCVSCHQIPFGLWSTQVAKDAGHKIDEELFQKQSKWALEFCDSNLNAKTMKRDGAGTDTIYQMLLSGIAAAEPDTTDSLATLLTTLQEPDGSFKPAGQLPSQKRPVLETTQVSTGWAAIMYNDIGSKQYQGAADNALKYSMSDFRGDSTEWLAVKSILDHQRQSKTESAALARLLESQQDDGGWGWDHTSSSDAFATGVALYALSRCGGTYQDVIDEARTFLIRTQSDDGNWIVPSTKKARNNKPGATSNYWGTCWAIIGLVSTE